MVQRIKQPESDNVHPAWSPDSRSIVFTAGRDNGSALWPVRLPRVKRPFGPAVGATVAQAPAEVTLWFTEPLEPAFSGVAVTKAAGERVDTGAARIDAKDPQELHVPLKPLASGDYKVSWHVVSADTHPTEGTFTFDVGSK